MPEHPIEGRQLSVTVEMATGNFPALKLAESIRVNIVTKNHQPTLYLCIFTVA